jgi:MarR family transcriptional regulator, temperature-dependent positive regulator of motility
MTEDHSILQILETLSESADAPQRQIAASTGLNLAKVNFVLRKLKDKGFVKLKRVRDNPHKLKYLYLLTPDGVKEKSRLTYRFMQRTLKEYNQAESRIRDSVELMVAHGIRRVVLWGHTEITRLCLRVIQSIGAEVRVMGVVDPSGKHPNALHPSQVEAMDVDAVVVCEPDIDGIPIGTEVWKLV